MPKLKEVLHQDFADCSVLAEVLADAGDRTESFAQVSGLDHANAPRITVAAR